MFNFAPDSYAEVARLIGSMYKGGDTYKGKTVRNRNQWNVMSYFSDKRTSTEAMLAISPPNDFGDSPVIAVCFKGSEQFKDWFLDLEFFKCKWTLNTMASGCTFKVHRGFYRSYRAIRLKFLRELRDAVSYCQSNYGLKPNLIIAGHSLGGAVAHLACMDLAWQIRNKTIVEFGNILYKDCVTFGSPKQVSVKDVVRAKIDGHPLRSFIELFSQHRMHVDGDPVPLVPRLGYKHTGDETMLHFDKLSVTPIFRRVSMDHHNIDTYINLLSLS